MFIGHGNPMNAITENTWRSAWQQLGAALARPRAVLCISAHWETPHPALCVADPPRTIHDFGGFPEALYAQRYAAPGAPFLAEEVRALAPQVAVRNDWGLDHGAWCVLASLFPAADVPVAQLSLGQNLDARAHLALARSLAPLRDAGVLVLASGNIVHNLRMLGRGAPPAWASEFDTHVREALLRGDDEALINPAAAGDAGRLAVNSGEHYLPLVYAAGMRHAQDQMSFLTEDYDLGSISMRSVVWRAA
jgi:4,5-DOPA dioxygenase extradiol